MPKTVKRVTIIDAANIPQKQFVKTPEFSAPAGTVSASNPPSVFQTVSKELPTIKNERKLHRRRSIVRDFSTSTSMHGLLGIARSESIHNRVFWSVSVLCYSAIMIYFVSKAIIAYFQYPTQISVDIIREWPQYFPAVSICNAEPFRLDKFIGPLINFTNALNLNITYNASNIPFSMYQYMGAFVIKRLNAGIPVEPLFFSLSSMLYTCKYNNIQCTEDDFISFSSATYGHCYTFNAKMKNSSGKSIRYGTQYGGSGILTLELFVHNYQYVPFVWSGYGMIALVHDNADLPLVDEAGIQLAPGRGHKLGYTKKTTFFLSSPYTSCTSNIPLSMKVMLDNYYNGADYQYSESVCYTLCAQTYAYVQCGCVSPYLWNARSIVLPGTDRVILALVCEDISPDSCYSRAIDTLLSSNSLQAEYCADCTQQCSITEFVIRKSGLALPLEWQMNGIKAFAENSTVQLPADWSTAWRTYIPTNYLSLSVVRETDIVENSTQTAQLGLVDVLSNIGGQTGLWIGISFLSLMEFAEMVYRLIRYQCYLIKQSLQRNQQTMS